MSKITVGRIIPNREDTRRDLLWRALAPLRWKGYPEGMSIVELEGRRTFRIDIDATEASILLQMDGLVGKIVDGNREAIIELTGSIDIDDHLAIAWFALWPVRAEGYGDGEYTVKIPGGIDITFIASTWDAMLLRKVDNLLDDLYRENWEAVDRVLSPESVRVAA